LLKYTYFSVIPTIYTEDVHCVLYLHSKVYDIWSHLNNSIIHLVKKNKLATKYNREKMRKDSKIK